MTGAVPPPEGGLPGRPPHVANHVGDVHGPSVQAGYVPGSIHFHTTPAYQPPPFPPPVPAPPRRRSVLRSWVPVVLGALLVASLVSPVASADHTAAQGRNGVLLLLQGLGVPVVRTLVERGRGGAGRPSAGG